MGTLLSEELSLELGLRNRLKELVESRLTWACLLHDSLVKHYDGPSVGRSNHFRIILLSSSLVSETENSFSDSACDAYRAIHEKTNFLVGEDESKKVIVNERPVLPEVTEPVHKPRVRQNSGYYSNIDRRDSVKFLFIRDAQATPPMLWVRSSLT